jgi:3-oxoacyl-[acyl-carrier protein] reductase
MNRAAFDYGGHRVLVTGGTSGIGNSIACAFRDAGAAVTVTGTRPSAAPYDTDLAGMAYRQLQMTDRDAVQALGESFDVLDVLINNAGTGRVDEWEPEGFEATVGVNLFGPFRLTMACYPALKASTAAGGSSVIFVMSMASFQAIPIVPGYGSSKAGMLQLNRNLAVQWSCDGIRVNGIAPGLIVTPMTSMVNDVPEYGASELSRIPMGRFGSVDDVAPAVLFLCSAQAAYITGQTMPIDGGRLAW